MKFLSNFCLFLLFTMRLIAQEKFDAEKFKKLNAKDRYSYATKVFLTEAKDTVSAKKYFQEATAIALQKKDYQTELLLSIQYYSYVGYMANIRTPQFVKAAIIATIHKAEEYDEPIELNISRMHYGGFLFNRENNYDKAYEIFLRAYNGFEEIGFKLMQHYPGEQISGLMYYPALNFYQLEDFQNAIKFLQIAYQYPNYENIFISWQVINTLGLCYLKINEPMQAIKYFQKGYEYATTIKSGIWQGISYGNIGNALIKMNKHKEALPYVKLDYENSLKYNEKESQFNALSNFLEIYFFEKKYKEVEKALEESEAIYQELHAKLPNYFTEFKLVNIYKFKANVYEAQGNVSKALFYNKNYIVLKDSLNKRNDARRYKLIQQRLEAEKYVAKVNQLEEEKKNEILKRNTAIFILIIGVTFGLIKYRGIRAKQKRAELELDAFTKNFKAKSELADTLQQEISNLILQGQQVEALEQLKRKTILTEEDWSGFKTLFDKVYPNFINDLYNDNQEITPAEVRLLALSKLNLRDQEMANMLGVSIDAIRKARYRFRKKTAA